MIPRAKWMWAIILAVAFAQATASRAQESTGIVRVATFNVLNYLEMDRRIEGRFRPAYPKPESEKVKVRR